MPLVRRTTSALGNEIVGSIEGFISDNAKAAEADTESSPDDGAKAIAHAIAYGIAKAFSSNSIMTGFQTGGIVPPSGGPAGTILYNAIKPSVVEI